MNWHLKPNPPQDFINQFPEYSPIVLKLLYDRDLKTQEQIDEFFSPDYNKDLHDPFLMLGMDKAVKRISAAIKRQEKFAIFGDYDADGVCGAVILKTVLEALGGQISGIYIPNRMIEGYGLNNETIKKAAQAGAQLIITVDCGVNDFEEVDLANSLGLDVIICDHHTVGEKLPKAKVIIDPFQKNDRYPFRDLAGAGVAFKLAQALLKNDQRSVISDKLQKGWEKWLLDLVAIATVADCMPLLGENRTLVRYGLIVLAQTQRVGLQELMKIARLDPTFKAETLKTNLDTYSLGFILAPRLNAAGRIEHANLALDLLLSQDQAEAQELSKKIDDFNRKRQKITDEIMMQIEDRIKKYPADENGFVIVEGDPDWSPGIIGLVAGRVADRFHRPTFIFNLKEGASRGSARSIPAFNIIEAIRQCSDLLSEFGGHAGSAGLKIESKKIPEFKERMNQIASDKLKKEDLVAAIEIDTQLEPQDANWELFDQLLRFEPFGRNNEKPVFLMKNLEISEIRSVGSNGKHMKFVFLAQELPGKKFKAIGFNMASKNGHLKAGDKVDLVFELIVDEWNGNRELQLKIIDIRKV